MINLQGDVSAIIKAEIRSGRAYFAAAMSLFMLGAVCGVLGAAKLALPEWAVSFLRFEILRPLHTFWILAGMFFGLQGALAAALGKEKSRDGALNVLMFGLTLCFSLSGSIALLASAGSGREYISWPAWAGAPIVLVFLLLCFRVFLNRKPLEARSPEAFWLIGFGAFFMLAGMLESHLYILEGVGHNPVKNLTVHWHGVDTIIAGSNAFLYGMGMLAMARLDHKARPLRGQLLFWIAVFSLLFTFGHHHYASPQPLTLKWLALGASMVAMLSFIRHLRALPSPKKNGGDPVLSLFHSVEIWTLVAAGSGILFAIPQVNLLVHGTYLVLVHAMGSMVGVSFLIIVACALSYTVPKEGLNPTRVRLGLRQVNLALVLLWGFALVTGLQKGFLRLHQDYFSYQELRGYFMLAFPIIGLLLLSGVLTLGWEFFRASRRLRRRRAFQGSASLRSSLRSD